MAYGSQAVPRRKLVRFGVVSLRVPEDWQVGGNEDDGFWAAPVDGHVVLRTWHEGFAHDGDVETAVAEAVEQARAFNEGLALLGPLRVSRENERTWVFAACDFSAETDPGVDFRWYVFVPEGDAVVVLRIRLICVPDLAGSAEIAALVDDVEAQLPFATLHLAGHVADTGRRAIAPPEGTFDEFAERTFFGRLAIEMPTRWRCRRLEDNRYWCATDFDLASAFVLAAEARYEEHPEARDPSASLGELVAGMVATFAEQEAVTETAVRKDVDRPVVRLRWRDHDDDHATDDPSRETVVWVSGQQCGGAPMIATIWFGVPSALRDEPVYRRLEERLEQSVLSCRIVGTDDPRLPCIVPAGASDYGLDELVPRTAYGFVHVCVPHGLDRQENENGRIGFYEDGVHSGALWVDVERFAMNVGSADPRKALPDGAGEAPFGYLEWSARDGHDDDGPIRIHQGCYFVTDRDVVADQGGMIIVFFNIVILKELEDHPEMKALVATIKREVALAHFG